MECILIFSFSGRESRVSIIDTDSSGLDELTQLGKAGVGFAMTDSTTDLGKSR
jgi:hypothetical protein